MRTYRLSKYNPTDRIEGIYQKDEWTSISDVGRSFDGIRFEMEMYLAVEQRYVDMLTCLAKQAQAFPLHVMDLEPGDECIWHEGQVIDVNELVSLVRDCLREVCWCKLAGKDFFIHFGYDYYLYVGCKILPEQMNEIAARFGLFSEERQSPYHD